MPPVITSAQNPTIKQLRKLLSSNKARRETNTYILEGIHLADSYLKSGAVPLSYVCAAAALENEEVIKLSKTLERIGTNGIVVADSLFESFSNIHASVGLMLLFTPDASPPARALSANAILLEDIQDPGNLGTILRTAASARVSVVYLSSDCTSPWSPKALRAGMGAQFALTIHENSDLATYVTESQIPVLATSLETSSSIYQRDLSGPTAWLFGNEGKGVSKKLLSLNVEKVIIPQNPAVESLNVAAAVAVCLFEQTRQQTI